MFTGLTRQSACVTSRAKKEEKQNIKVCHTKEHKEVTVNRADRLVLMNTLHK